METHKIQIIDIKSRISFMTELTKEELVEQTEGLIAYLEEEKIAIFYRD